MKEFYLKAFTSQKNNQKNNFKVYKMNAQFEKINSEIEPLRQEIIQHKVYSAITTLEDLQIFMQYHIFAVWDFMSLLKSLQINLTCTSVPWFPIGSAETRHLINEIVAGEESDHDNAGGKKSHFELYLDAMNQCGANTSQIDTFIKELKSSKNLQQAFQVSNAPKEAENFVNFTFDIINTNKNHLQSAVFTFGREDLIPSMFHSIVDDIHQKFPENISIFKYYLDRHIEVDGEQHSHLSLQMTSNLCGTDQNNWADALEATVAALKMRIQLWDGAYNAIQESKKVFA